MDLETKLLIVDDDPRLLRAQVTLLKRADYRVFEAATGQEALRMAQEVKPDLVLLDVMLPDVSGLEVCRRIKANPALGRTMVLILSGVRTASHEQAEALEAGADGVIARPVSNRELLARVEALVRIQRAEQRRRASEARYRDLFENAPIGIYATTPDGDILMANPPLVEMLGYDSFEELAQRDLESEGYHPNYPRSEFKRRIETEGQVSGLESAWRRRDGSTLFIRENARPVYDQDGRLIAYQGTVEDVTEKVERTRRLERLNTILDAIGEANQLVVRERDRGRLIAGVCERLVAADGYHTAWIALLDDEGAHVRSAQAGLGEREIDLCGAEALSQPEVWVGQAREGCRLANVYQDDVLMAARLAHAGTVYGLMTVSLHKGTVMGQEPLAQERTLFREMASDIAFALHAIELEEEHRKADRALEASERRQSLILNSTAETFTYCNTDLEIQWANQAAADSAGLSPEELEGRHCYAVWHQRDEPCEGCPVLKALETRVPQQDEQTTPDGRIWAVRGYPVLDEDGEVEGLVEFTQEITERRAAEAALRESEKRYRVLFESTGAATCVFGDDGVIRMCNEGFVALAGLPKEAIEGQMTWSDFVIEEDLSRMQRYHTQRGAGRGDPPGRYAFTFVDGQGEEKDIYLEIGIVEETGERVASLTDVTPLKQAEQALRESERRYRLHFENVSDVIYSLDAEGKVTDVSPSVERILGYQPQELIGRSLPDPDVLAPASMERALEDTMRVMSGERVESAVYQFITRDGSRRWGELSAAPLMRDGQVAGIVSVARDITERKLAEEELQENEERLRRIVEGTDALLVNARPNGAINYVNETTAMKLGRPAEDLIGRFYLRFVHPEDRERVGTIYREQFESKAPSTSAEFRLATADGDERWVSFVAHPIIREGQVVEMAGLALDITERKEMEEQLRQQERLAAVGQLAGGIAHDFNNILAAIILYAQMALGRGKVAASTKKALGTILEESHRAADLVQQILDFSRSAMMETERLDLTALVEDDAALLRRTIPEHIRLVTEMTSRPCTIEADRTRIHQALMNLAFNARDAMPEGGELRIGVKRTAVAPGEEPPAAGMPPGMWACMTVSDSGTGLSEEAQEHLFEPFFTTKEQGEGTGLGLAQVYGIVKQHQGFIDVETAQGVGTTFTIFLPLVADEADEEDAEKGANPLQGQGETILVVEDAERLRRAIQAGLQAMGYHVLTAAHGRRAIEIVSEHQVDLVLTDVIMPHMGGEALLRELRARDPDLRVIAMTGHVMDANVKGLEARGFAAALPKPFSIEELTQVVRKVLDRES